MKHIISLIILICCFTVNAQQKIIAEDRAYDAGSIKQKDVVFADYEIKNISNTHVTVSNIKCTAYAGAFSLLKKTTIPPGKTVKLPIKFQPTADTKGDISAKIDITLLGGKKSSLKLDFEAYIIHKLKYTNFIDTPTENPIKFTADSNKKIYFALFFKPGCIECSVVDKILDDLKVQYPYIITKTFDISQPENIQLLKQLAIERDVPEELQLLVPEVYTGQYYFFDKALTKANFEKLVQNPTSEMLTPVWNEQVTDSAQIKTNLMNQFKNFTFPSVLLAGLVDGVNPCAFAVLIFLLSYLQIAKYTGKQLIGFGILYTFFVFITYFLIGAGFLQGMKFILVNFPSAALYFFIISGILAIIFGILSLTDVIIILKYGPEKMILQLSKNVKERTRALIRKRTKKTFLISSIVFTAITISLLELGCTGEVYLPVISYIIQTTENNIKALLYLFFYNLAFIAPLVIVFVLYFFGTKFQSISDTFKNRIVIIKAFMAIVFLVLGILILTHV